MEDLNKIKERIAKLLAMAEDTSSPEEAAIAASRARKLMDKYQLDTWQCQKDVKEPFEVKAATRVYAMVPEYMSWLATSVAKYNDCQAVYEWGDVTHRMSAKMSRSARDGDQIRGRGRCIVFRGYASDVSMAVDMYNRLLEAANRACKAYIDRLGFARYPVKEGTAFKAQFCSTVGDRLQAMTKERDELTFNDSGIDVEVLKKAKADIEASGAEAGALILAIETDIKRAESTSTSLVIVKTKAVEEHFGGVKYKEGNYSFNRSDDGVMAAARAGKIAGQTATIVQEIK